MKPRVRCLLLGLLGAVTAAPFVACGGEATSSPDADAGASSPDGGGGLAGDGSSDGAASTNDAGMGAYTLESCKTEIASDVPAFYRTYFRCVTITKTGGGVEITWNGLPPHPSNYWGAGSPNFAPFDTSRGAAYAPNPNLLSARAHTMTVPDAPASRNLTITSGMVDRMMNTNVAEYRGGPVGVAVDSVAIFNDQAAPGDDIAKERFTFDAYEGHPAPDGEYHYHTTSPGPLEALVARGLATSREPGTGGFELYGMMCDGTVVLGCSELDGTKPDTLGLDAQNGHVTDMKDAAGTLHFASRYHTHMCTALLPAHVYTPELQFYQACTVR